MKIRKGNSSVLVGVLTGAGCSVITAALITMIISSLLINEAIGENMITASILIGAGVSAFTGGIAAVVISKNKKLIAAILSGCVFLLSLAGINAALYGGALGNITSAAIAVFAGALAAGFMPIIFVRGRGHQIKKYRFG